MTQFHVSNPATLSAVQNALVTGRFWEGYRAIADDLQAQATAGVSIDRDTMFWYRNASEINNPNSTSAMRVFAKNYVNEYHSQQKGYGLPEGRFEEVSNQLAKGILQGVVQSDGVVKPWSQVGPIDTRERLNK